MRRPYFYVATIVLVLMVCVLLSPLGVFFLHHATERLLPVYGWTVAIGSSEGSLIGTFRFLNVRAVDKSGTIRIASDSLSLSALDWAISVQSGQIEVELQNGDSVAVSGNKALNDPQTATESTQFNLPLAFLPSIQIADGTCTIVDDSLTIEAKEIQARLSQKVVLSSENRAELRLTTDDVRLFEGSELTGSAQFGTLLSCFSNRIATDSLALIGSIHDLDFTSITTGSIGLDSLLQLDLESHVTMQSSSRNGNMHVSVLGPLFPRKLVIKGEGSLIDSVRGEGFANLVALAIGNEVVIDSYTLIANNDTRARVSGRLPYDDADSLHLFLDLRWLSPWLVNGELSVSAQIDGRPILGEIQAEVSAEGTNVQVSPGKPLNFALSTQLEGFRLSGLFESDIGVVEAAGTIETPSEYEVELSGHLDLGHFFSAELPTAVTGLISSNHLALELESEQVPGLDRSFAPLVLRSSVKDWHRVNLQLELDDGTMHANLVTDLKTGLIDTVHLEIRPTQLQRLIPDLFGEITVALDGVGSFAWKEATTGAVISLRELIYDHWYVGDLDFDLAFGDGRLLAGLHGKGLAVEATLDTAGQFLATAELDSATLIRGGSSAEEKQDRTQLTGTVVGEGIVGQRGTWFIKWDLDQFDVDFANQFARSEGKIHGTYQNGVAEIEPSTWATPIGKLTAAGHVADSLWVKVRVDSLSYTAIDSAISGLGSLQIQLSGTAEIPAVAGTLLLSDVSIGEQSLGRLQAEISYHDSAIVVLNLRQQGHDQEKRGNLDLRFSTPKSILTESSIDDSVHIRANAHNLNFGPIISYALQDSISGFFDGSYSLSFPFEKLTNSRDLASLSGAVNIARLHMKQDDLALQVPSGGADLLFGKAEPQVISLLLSRRDRESGEYNQTAGSVSIGMQGLPKGHQVTIELSQVDLRNCTAFGINEVDLPDGVVDALATLTDSSGKQLLTFHADVVTEDLGDLSADVNVTDSAANVSVLWSSPLADQLEVNGMVPIKQDIGLFDWDHAQFSALSEGINLLVFVDQVPDLASLDGFVRLNLTARDLQTAPQLHGELVVDELKFGFADVKPEYRFPHGRIQFSGQRGDIVDFIGFPSKGEGRAELRGHLAFTADGPDYDIVLDIDDFPYAYDDLFTIPGLRGQLRFHSEKDGSLLEGEIRLDDVVVETPLVDINAPPVPPPPPALQSPFLEMTNLNLLVDVRDMVVRNELTDLLMEGNARVYGTFYKPRFQGEMLVTEGTVIALNNEFSFTSGRIVLDHLVPTNSILDIAYDPLLLDPELQIEAVAQVRDMADDELRDVIMSLQGSAVRAMPVFSSSGLDDSQVIFLLAFGTSMTEGVAERDIYRAAGTAVGQLLLGRQVQRIGLDEFQLLPSGTVMGTVGQPAVRVGKHFNWPLPLWVRYEAITSEPSIGEVRLEYQLMRFITLRAEAHSEYELYGVGIGLKKKF